MAEDENFLITEMIISKIPRSSRLMNFVDQNDFVFISNFWNNSISISHWLDSMIDSIWWSTVDGRGEKGKGRVSNLFLKPSQMNQSDKQMKRINQELNLIKKVI